MSDKEITINSTVNDVFEYLKALKLEKHTFEDIAINFKNECVDGKVFLNLEKAELNDLGIFKFSRRNIFYKHIKTLRDKDINQGFDSPIMSNKISNNQASVTSPLLNLRQETENSSSEVIIMEEKDETKKPLIQLDLKTNAINNQTASAKSMPNALSSPLLSSLAVKTPQQITPNKATNASNIQLPVTPVAINYDNIATPTAMPSVFSAPIISPASWMIGQAIQKSQSNSYTNSSNFQPKQKVAPTFFPNDPAIVAQGTKIEPLSKNSKNNDEYVNAEVNNALKNNTGNHQEAKNDENNVSTNKVRSERCYYKVRRESKNVVKFIGVYRGINAAKQIFLLMSRRHVEQFNKIATSWANSTEVLESINSAIGTLDDESYNSHIDGSQDSSDEYQDPSDSKQQIIDTIFEFERSLNQKIGAVEQKVEDVHSQLAVTMCHANSAQQVFNSNLKITKLNNGWDVEGCKMPFNPMCVFTFDFFRNEIINISAMDVDGIINNIDCRGLMWITCSLKIDAIEDHQQQQNYDNKTDDKCGTISYIQYLDNRQQQFKDRDASYLIHDWININFDCDKGDKVKCCMKLSTKTNSKWKQRKRPVYIQTWNVRPQNNNKQSLSIKTTLPNNNTMNQIPQIPQNNYTYNNTNNYAPTQTMQMTMNMNNNNNMGYNPYSNPSMQMSNYTPTQQMNTMMMNPMNSMLNPQTTQFGMYSMPMNNIGSTMTMDTHMIVDAIMNNQHPVTSPLPATPNYGVPSVAHTINSQAPSMMIPTTSIPATNTNVLNAPTTNQTANGTSIHVTPQKNGNQNSGNSE